MSGWGGGGEGGREGGREGVREGGEGLREEGIEGRRCEPRDSEGEHFAFRDKTKCSVTEESVYQADQSYPECKAAHPAMPLTVTLYMYTYTPVQPHLIISGSGSIIQKPLMCCYVHVFLSLITCIVHYNIIISIVL